MTGDVTIEAGGGAVTSVNGQTGDVALGFSEISTTSTYTNFLPEGGDLSIALQDIDSVLTGKADYAHGHYGLLTGWRGQWDETTHNAGGYSQGDVVVIQNEYYTGLLVCAVSTSSGDVWPGDLGFPQISTSTLVVSVAGKSGVVTLGPSDVGAAALSHAHWVTPPTAADSTGTAGDTAYDSSYFYICTATDTWRRIAHQTW